MLSSRHKNGLEPFEKGLGKRKFLEVFSKEGGGKVAEEENDREG